MNTPKGRVLLIEDEDLVAMLTEDMLDTLGYQVAFTAATLEAGLRAAEDGAFDLAVVDVNLRGAMSFPIADVLLERGLPFIFASGYSAEGFEPRFRQVFRLQKPFTSDDLERALTTAAGSASEG